MEKFNRVLPKCNIRRRDILIFLTIGTQKFQFNRLLKYIDEKKASGEIKDEIYAQIGNSTYEPHNYKYKRFLNKNEFENFIDKSDLVITHSGVGTIINTIKKNKPIIVVPRLAKYGEHIDDHQLEIAESFADKGLIISNGENIENLSKNIEIAKKYKFNKYISSNKKIQNIILNYINENEKINVLMLGSDTSIKGGISSVIRNYLKYEKWQNFNIKFIPTHKGNNKIFKMLFFILSMIKIDLSLITKKYDIAHIHVSERGSIWRKRIIINHIKRLSKETKIILHHHGAEFDRFYNNLNENKKQKVNDMLGKVDVNIVLSKRLINTIRNKRPDAKIDVLYKGVNVNDRNLYNNDGNIILFLGRLGTRKGIYDLLNVIYDIKGQLKKKNIEVYMCGNGEIDKVKKIVKEYDLETIVQHIGWINAEEKVKIFKKCIINILPSYNEGLPMTILETMSWGIPNISTNIASIPEVIKNGQNGYLIKPGDKKTMTRLIMKLVNDKEKRFEISKNAYNTISNEFSLETNVEKLKKIYIKTIKM